MAMKLSTGKVAFPLYFDNGDVENLMINPHDTRLQERIRGLEASIRKRIESINLEKYKDAFAEDIDVKDLNFDTLINMSAEELEKVSKRSDAIAEIDKRIEEEFCKEFDVIFDSDVSSKAFKYVPPLAMVENEDGEPEIYIMQVLRALAVEVQNYANKNNNATNKYVAKYRK